MEHFHHKDNKKIISGIVNTINHHCPAFVAYGLA
jgi:hypothetical protein